jgi:hypothetical protein
VAFEEVLDLTDRVVQKRLQNVPDAVLAEALPGMDRAVTEKIVKNLSERRRRSVAGALRADVSAETRRTARGVLKKALLGEGRPSRDAYRKFLESVPVARSARREREGLALLHYLKSLLHAE